MATADNTATGFTTAEQFIFENPAAEYEELGLGRPQSLPKPTGSGTSAQNNPNGGVDDAPLLDNDEYRQEDANQSQDVSYFCLRSKTLTEALFRNMEKRTKILLMAMLMRNPASMLLYCASRGQSSKTAYASQHSHPVARGQTVILGNQFNHAANALNNSGRPQRGKRRA